MSHSPLFMRVTKQKLKHKAAIDVTRTWIISQGIPSLGKVVNPKGGVVNDCRTLTSMKALMVPHFRHIIERNRQHVITIHEGLGRYGVSHWVIYII